MYNKVGVRFADLTYPMKMKYFALTESKLFHFHRIFKNGGGGTPAPPLDPPLIKIIIPVS